MKIEVFSKTKMHQITLPDDFHHHLRDGVALNDTVFHASQQFGRVLAMPNLKPPICTLHDAVLYRARILACNPRFTPLMTLYLTDVTTPEDVEQAFSSGSVSAVKYYPSGATTNSEYGVTSISRVYSVLQKMSEIGMPLLVHGEVADPNIDIFDRESHFISTIMIPIVSHFPALRVVLEHITTEEAVEFVQSQPPHIAATITAHHLLYNRNALFQGGICPHKYCLPVLKRERHRKALLAAATSGNPKFFLGTDSAPHNVDSKQSACGCAGIFTSHAAIELYAEAFAQVGALDKLEAFASHFGADFYGLPRNTDIIVLKEEPWIVPEQLSFGNSVLVPLRGGEVVLWKKQ